MKGLTSAAALWVTAALGMAAAMHRWSLAVGGAALTVFVLTVARRFEPARVKGTEEKKAKTP